MQDSTNPVVKWQSFSVRSPSLSDPVNVVAARNILYVNNGHHFQTLSIYLPNTNTNTNLVGTPATALPSQSLQNTETTPYHVHIHGGAWRDPFLTCSSIEPAVAHAFSRINETENKIPPITAIISLNYTISPYPTHPTSPYDPRRGDRGHPEREAHHPAHIRDVLSAFSTLRDMGLSDGSYILSGHSCGACLAFQAALQQPTYWGLPGLRAPPQPVALIGLNGLYDLPALVHDLGPTHAHLRDVYEDLLGIAFGTDQSKWPRASPACFDVHTMASGVRDGTAPRLILIDQSADDQLVPMNELDRIRARLEQVELMRVVRLHRCTGTHAEPWEKGDMIWESVRDALRLLQDVKQ